MKDVEEHPGDRQNYQRIKKCRAAPCTSRMDIILVETNSCYALIADMKSFHVPSMPNDILTLLKAMLISSLSSEFVLLSLFERRARKAPR